MYKIAFIGMGNMGSAIAKGLLKKEDVKNMAFTRKSSEKAREFENNTGIKYIEDVKELVKSSQYIMCAVKPQMYDQVLPCLKNLSIRDKIIISLAPGISISKIKEYVGEARIVRAMPNTPALVGEGMTGICYDEKDFTDEEILQIDYIFSSFGKYVKVEEKYMNAIVCMSGSSPAYMYMFIDVLANCGLALGLGKLESIKLVAQTMLGTAKTVLETGEHPEVLKDKVCSPAGTTIAGVMALEENGFRKAVQKANEACYKRCIEFSDKGED